MESISPRKQQLLDEQNAKPFVKGDIVVIARKYLTSTRKDDFPILCTVQVIESDNVGVVYDTFREPIFVDIINVRHWTNRIGENPFRKERGLIHNINFTLESILHITGLFSDSSFRKRSTTNTKNGTVIEESNDDPYVIIDGKLQYYQRPLVWTTLDKQLIISSIYNNVDCGKILVRNRSFKELEKIEKLFPEAKLAFKDIVDGKQRLNAIHSFINNEFPDEYNNYYSDLSKEAQSRLTNNQLISYSELSEDSNDEDVLHQFLKLNHAGIPQSKEHLDFVKSLYNKF